MKIKVYSNGLDPLKLCAQSSYLSHSPLKVTELFESNFPKNPLNYLKKIVKMGHSSVLEHAYFNILVEDAPVINEIFCINFRLASFTVKSRRYTDVLKDGFYEEEKALLEPFFEQKIKDLYEKMKEGGIPLEDARFVLPYSFKTNFVMSINARELGYLLYSALNENPVPAIQKMAKNIIAELSDVFPLYEEDDLKVFQKGVMDIEPILEHQMQYKPLNFVELLSSPSPETELFYQNLLSFKEAGDFYKEDQLDSKKIFESIFLAHNRALESLNYTFYLKEITLAGLTHLLRHRMQSLIFPNLYDSSLKYNLMVPKSIKESAFYDDFIELATLSRKLEREHKNFYYRLVAATFPVVTTLNARELLHFFKLRLCKRAQWEIRELAALMLAELKKASPLIFRNCGPGCVNGMCPEDSHSCGSSDEMRKLYLD